MAHSVRLYGDAVTFQEVSGQSFQLRVLPVGARITQPGQTAARRVLGVGRTRHWALLSSFPVLLVGGGLSVPSSYQDFGS